MDDTVALVQSLAFLGYGLIFCGKFAEAHSLAEEQMRLCQDLGNRPLLVRAQTLRVAAATYLGRYEQARVLAQLPGHGTVLQA